VHCTGKDLASKDGDAGGFLGSTVVGLTDFSLRHAERNNLRFPARASSADKQLFQGETPFRVFQSLRGQRKADELLQILPIHLRPYLSFDYISVMLRKEGGDGRTWYVLDGQDPSALTCTKLAPSEELLAFWVVEHQEPAVIANFEQDTRFSRVNKSVKERALKSVCAVPLTTAHCQVGAILIGSVEPSIYSQEQAQLLSGIADQIAMAVDNALSHAELKHHEALSRLATSLASCAPEDLSRDLATLLRPLLDFDFLDVIVFKEGSSEVLWHSIGAGPFPPSDVPMEQTTFWWVHQQQQPLCIADWKRDERFAVRREVLKKLGTEYRSLCRLPLRTPHCRLGVFSVASSHAHDYSQEDLRFLSRVADQVALAIANALNLETSRRAQSELEVKSARLRLLLDLTNSTVAIPALHDVLKAATITVRRAMRSDFAVVALPGSEGGRSCVNAFDFSDDTTLDEETVKSLVETLGRMVFLTGKPWAGNADDLGQIGKETDLKWAAAGFRHSCVLPLRARDQVLGLLALSRREEAGYTEDEVDFLNQVSSQVAMAVENALVRGEQRKPKDDAVEERVCPENEVCGKQDFAQIVGKSVALQRALRQVEIVAPTDAGVLIQGETGTGKELIARAIHNMSARRDRPFVKLNCAAIPSGLLESELFGHEKGAFTGAIIRKAGRFEAADKGTLFLDEVGDIPLELQPKLLRVLQEQEFERLGSTRTQQVDVRVIAATHRDLKEMVEDGLFRMDLFYRLHVFPLRVPPLRDRREDIPTLVRHYMNKYARQMNRRIETIPAQAMEVIASYPWPGNVRELQHFIERAVLLSPGLVLRPPLDELKQVTVQEHGSKLSALEETEREHVLRAIREANWVIGGPHGAAARLGMKRTTLAYRIRKLNIRCRPQ
jgi:formate hydrogenlyase transcriptional activator